MIYNQQNINKLLEAGKLEDDDKHMVSVLMSLKHLQSFNCGRPKQWTEIAQGLNIPDLIALNKGLTRAEFYHNWPGGSAAAVIWTFRVFEARCPEEVNHMADWILQRTKNSYLPYGDYSSWSYFLCPLFATQTTKG